MVEGIRLPSRNEIPSGVRKAVISRDFDRCVRCATQGTEIQHRMRRREGGHGLANLVRICRVCHEWVHRHPVEAHRLGLTVKTWEEPSEVPLLSWRGWIYLRDDGFIAPCDAPSTRKEEP